MKGWIYVFFLFVMLQWPVSAQRDSALLESLKTDVFFLASDRLEGRAPDTEGGRMAADWIVKRFESIGLQPFIKNTYIQPFSYSEEGRTVHTDNLLAQTNPEKPCKLLITAHYDHLGFGNAHSREVFKNVIHNGADDNASGVALLLALAEWFVQKEKESDYGMLFVCFSGHESGLFGSEFFVQQLAPQLQEVQAVLDLDMVGRLDDAQSPAPLYFRLSEPSSWKEALLPVSTPSLKVVVKPSGAPLDHTAFQKIGLPAATFSTGLHADYHRSTDDAERINYEGMVQVFFLLKNLSADSFNAAA
jgi:Zn-dependent M28 family amino/carboxypeptidase